MPIWAQRPRARAWQGPTPDTAAAAFHASLPGYRPTPLIALPALAAELGVAQVWVKDESARLGLPAFKILGASWAVNRALCDPPAADLDRLRAAVRGPTVLVTATDGNHGRAVARMAALLGIRARVYVPEGVAVAPIAGEGAEVVAADPDYDLDYDPDYDAVVRRAAASVRPGEVLVQDTAWPGYTAVPRWVVDGYETLFAEVDGLIRPDVVVVPTGVGSLLQAALVHYCAPSRSHRPAVVAVEPEGAACVGRSLAAGEPVTVDTGSTIMAGLNCGTVSAIAWPVIAGGLDAAVTVSDEAARAAVTDLRRLGVDAGPCGAAALAGARTVRPALDLDAGATVLLISTEGPHEP